MWNKKTRFRGFFIEMVEVPGIEPGSKKGLQLALHAFSFIESCLRDGKRHPAIQTSSIVGKGGYEQKPSSTRT